MNDGRTTGLMLKAMADASLHRGEFIEFHDHCDLTTLTAARSLRDVMRQMAEALGLDYDINITLGHLRPHIILRWRKEQTEPATVGDSTRERLSRISTGGAKVPSDMTVLASAVLSILERDEDNSVRRR